MTLNIVNIVINVEPSNQIEGYDILEVECCIDILFVGMMDLGVGWIERHETILKKFMKLFQ